MAGHAKKCVERYLANKTTQQLCKVSTSCIDDHHFKEEETKSVGELSHVCSQPYFKRLSQIAFPITALPMDDHIDFAQEERLGLPYWTMIWAICVVVDESKCLDIPILGIFNNL